MFSLRSLQYTLLWMLTLINIRVEAEWSSEISNHAYYTDDVALFSVTQRLSLKDDPTQPTVDRPGQGGDFVYEPSATLTWQGKNDTGTFLLAIDAGGYLFADQAAFSHGLYELRLAQTFDNASKISLHYNAVPDLFLGKNAYGKADNSAVEFDESLTNHYWSVRFDQPLSPALTVRLFGRYGLRNYNAPFQHRDTQFWTLGPHLEWLITSDAELLIGYHYEQGTTNQQRTMRFADDVAYINQYASAELKIRLLEQLSAIFIFDYETNGFTSHNLKDEHRGVTENIYQGEIELLYKLTGVTTLKFGWQQGNRQLTNEQSSINNNNFWLGFDYDI